MKLQELKHEDWKAVPWNRYSAREVYAWIVDNPSSDVDIAQILLDDPEGRRYAELIAYLPTIVHELEMLRTSLGATIGALELGSDIDYVIKTLLQPAKDDVVRMLEYEV